MTLDKSHPSLSLNLLKTPFYTLQYPPSTPIPPNIFTSDLYSSLSISRNTQEISIIVSLPQHEAIDGVEGMGKADEVEGPWSCIMVTGPMELSMTGVMAALTKPLEVAGVPIFALSTWNTDYLLIPEAKSSTAKDALALDGWTFNPS